MNVRCSISRRLRNPVGAGGRRRLAVRGRSLLGPDARFMFKSLRRNLLRTVLTGLATSCWCWSSRSSGASWRSSTRQTEDKSKNLKAIVTEKYQIPSHDAERLRRQPGRRAPAASRATTGSTPTGRHDLGVLRRHHRPEQEDARQHHLLLLHGAAQADLPFDEHGNFTTMMDDIEQFTEGQANGWRPPATRWRSIHTRC